MHATSPIHSTFAHSCSAAAPSSRPRSVFDGQGLAGGAQSLGWRTLRQGKERGGMSGEEEAGLESPHLSDDDGDLVLELEEPDMAELSVEAVPEPEPEAGEEAVEEPIEPAPAPAVEEAESLPEPDLAAVVPDAVPEPAIRLADEEEVPASPGITINFSMDDDAELEDQLAEMEEYDSNVDETTRFAPGWLTRKPFSCLAPVWFRFQALSNEQKKTAAIAVAVVALLVTCVVAGAVIFLVVSTDEPSGTATQGAEKDAFVTASNGVVAGVAIMQDKGGNAVDAAVATCLCVGVVQPFSSGIGGGAVIVVRLANGTALTIDSREVAPAAATADMFVDDPSLAEFGALASGVPGELRGLHTAWETYGSGNVAWKDLFDEAIVAAESMEVTELMVQNLNDAGWEKISASPGLAELYIKDDAFVEVGDVIKRPQLAATLRSIANKGVDEFYTGTVARNLISDLTDIGGIITLDDLANYRVEIRDTVHAKYHGVELFGAPPPFGSVVAMMAFNIVEGFELATNDSQSMHYLAEAWKFAFDDRRLLGDPAFQPDNFTDIVDTMLSKEHAAELRRRIDPDSVLPLSNYTDLSPVGESVDDHGTMHLNTVDSEGNAVALTSTVNLLWGSKFVSPSTGIVLNNQMDDFSTPGFSNHFGVPPHESNYIAPGKRPLSSMNPLIVTKGGRLTFLVGASGGTKIITGPMQVLLNCLFFNYNVGEAVGLPRIHDQLLPQELKAEADVDERLLLKLEARGHNVTRLDPGSWLANTAAIQVVFNEVENTHTLYGASDYRKNAAAAGY